MIERVIHYRDSHKRDAKTVDKNVVSSALLSQYPNPEAVINEVFAIFGAAVAGPSWILAVTLFNVCTNPEFEARLMKELKGAFPNKDEELNLGALERLPYFTAVLKETLRLHPSTVCLFPRMPAVDDLTICGIHIPRGVRSPVNSHFTR